MAGIDHLSIAVPEAKLEEEVKFLEAALAPLCVKELFRPVPLVAGLGDSMQNMFLWVSALDSERQPIADGDSTSGPLTNPPADDETDFQLRTDISILGLYGALSTLNWKPRWCRWDPGSPPKFSIWLNLLFAFAGAFTVANLYYNHPILNILAESFDVPYLTVSRVPTLMQGGYATGLLFICPLADLFPRRPYTLVLVLFTATMWIGLCVTNNFNVFLILSYLTAMTTVTPQIMLPLVAELAPPEKRAFSLSIVVSGNLLGIVLARILSGVVTNYTYWRNIYWIALGLNYGIWLMLWLFMPDYPSANPNGLNYISMLWSILVMCKRHPVLVYAGIVSYCNSAAFMSYWTTLTFLLAGSPYHYNSVYIGLFALIGIAAMLLGPVYAKYLIQPFQPWLAVVIGETISLAAVALGTYIGSYTVAGPIIEAFGLDAGFQITQVANRAAIHNVEPQGRNRVNTAYMLFTFLGQLTGTSAGNKLYERG
ncbi:hypothetical protein DV737_g868, partial [Chaetothyriales sp. CBS 132003]